VTGDFCAILACVGVGGTENGDQHLVNDFCSILDMAKMDGVRLGVSKILGEYMRKNLKRLRA
jgi:hypothetical protein